MNGLEDIMKEIAGQDTSESINAEEEAKLEQVESPETPNESVEPVENDGDNVADPEDVDTPMEATASEGEEEGEEDDLDFDLDFDFSTDDSETADTPAYDFSKLGNVLGKEINSEEEFVNSVQSLQAKVKELETSASQIDDIPTELMKAVQIAKQGGDYKTALQVNSVDYSNADPVEVFENYVIDQLSDENGQVDEAQLESYLDSMSDVEKHLKGKELISTYQREQQTINQRIEQEAAERQAKAEEAIKSAVNSKERIAGFKLKPEHKQDLVNSISSGQMVKDLFYGKDGQYDFGKMAEAYFIVKNFDKIQKVYENKIKNGTKKEILENTTNTQLDRTKHQTNPDTKANPIDAYMAQLEQQYRK